MAQPPVLGQDPILPEELNDPSLDNASGTAEDLKSRKERLAKINQSIGLSTDVSRSFNLPPNVNTRQFNRLLGKYSAVEGVDIPEAMAQAQSGAEQLAYLIPRALTKAATEAAKVPGFIAGVGEWALTGFDPAEYGNAFNNAWNVALDNFNETIQSKGLPVYTPQSVQDGNIWDKLKSSSFWATEGADGVGFLLGMMAPGALIRWGKLGPKAAKLFSSAEKLSKPIDDIEAGLASAKTGALINDWTAAGVNTVFEAATEGQQSFNDFLAKNPGDLEGAGKAASNTFLINNAILLGPNILQQKWLFNGFKRSEQAVKGAGKNAIAETLDKTLSKTTGELTAIPKTGMLKKALNVAKYPAKGILSEGFFEEGFQYATQQAALKGESVDPFNLINEYIEDITADTKGNTEMWSSIVLGGLMGGVMGGIGGISNASKEKKLASDYHNLLQNNYLNYLKTYRDYAKVDEAGNPIMDKATGKYELDIPKLIAGGAQAIKNAGLREQAIEAFNKKDKENYDNITNLIHFDYMLPWLQIEGGSELLKRHIKAIAKRENEKDIQALGIATKDVSEIEKGLLSKIDKFQEIYNKINDTHDINFPVKLIEGADKADLATYSDMVKSNKLSAKVTMDYASERLNVLRNKLSAHGITSKEFKITDKLVDDLNKSYEDQKAIADIDKTEDVNIKGDLNNIKRLTNLYKKASDALSNAYDETKLKNGFKEMIDRKIAAQKKKDSATTETAKTEEAKDIVDPGVKDLWLNHIKYEDLSVAGEKAVMLTHRGIVKINYKDKSGNIKSILATIGNKTKNGHLSLYEIERDKKGNQTKTGTIWFLGDLKKISNYANKTGFDIVGPIETIKSAEDAQREDQLSAARQVYEQMINEYKANRDIIEDNIKKNKEKISEIKELLRQHQEDRYTKSGSERKIYSRLLKLSKTTSELNDLKSKLEKDNITLTERKKNYLERRKEREVLLKQIKNNELFPQETLTELINYAADQEAFSDELLTTVVDSITDAEKTISITSRLLKGYHTQLSKLLNIDISDKALGTEGLSESERLKAITIVLGNKVRELKEDVTGDSYIFPALPDYLANIMFNAQDKIDTANAALAELEEIDKAYSEHYIEFRTKKLALQSQYNKILKQYKRLVGSHVAESDVYESNIVDSSQTLSSGLEEHIQNMYTDLEQIEKGNWEAEEKHVWEDFNSLLTITSNQDEVENNPDVARWFAFINNDAYKGLDNMGVPKYALKTFTFDDVAKGPQKMRSKEDGVKFYVGDGKVMSYNEIVEKPKEERDKLIEIARNDIKVVLIDYKKEEPIFSNVNGELGEGKEYKKYIYSSLLEKDLDKRFSFKKAKLKYQEASNVELTNKEITEAVDKDFRKQVEEYEKFRSSLRTEQKVLYLSGINPGHKETIGEVENAELLDSLGLETKDLYRLVFKVPSLQKSADGFPETISMFISGNETKGISGYTYLMYQNRYIPVKQKTLEETKSVNDIFNAFRYVAKKGKDWESVLTYLKNVLDMATDNDEFKLFFVKKTDKAGKVVDEFDKLVFDKDSILIEDLANNINSNEFKKFLGTKYWNFKKSFLDSKESQNGNIKFTEYKVNNKLVLTSKSWDTYKQFLFSTKDKNVTKGTIKIKPAPKGINKKILLAKNPQFSNQSLRTYIKGTQVAANDTLDEPTGEVKVVKVTITRQDKSTVEGHIAYFPKDSHRILLTHTSLEGKTLLEDKEGIRTILKAVKNALKKGTYDLDTFKNVTDLEDVANPVTLEEVETIQGSEEKAIESITIKESEAKGLHEQVLIPASPSTHIAADQLWDNLSGSLQTKFKEVAVGKLAEQRGISINKIDINDEAVINIAKNDAKSEFESEDSNKININFDRLAKKIDNYQKENTDKAKEWFHAKFPGFPIEVVDYLIENKAWGKFEEGAKVLLSRLAEEGTIYHEAFHVWNVIFNSIENRNSLYSEVRKRLNNKDLTDTECEEFLAEEFRDYVMQGKDYVFNHGTKIEEFFKKLWNYIKHFLKQAFDINLGEDTQDQIEEAFRKLNEGKFIERLNESTESFMRIAGVKPSEEMALIKDINYRFFSVLTEDLLKGGTFIFEFEQNANSIYDAIKDKYEIIEAGRKVQKRVGLYQPVLDHWEEFVEKHKLFLTQYKLDLRDQIDEDEIISRNMVDHKPSFTKPLKDSVPSPLRLLIGSLPHISRVSIQDDTVTWKAMKDEKYMTVTNVEYNKTMNLLYNSLANIVDPQKLLDKVLELSETNPSFTLLHRYIGGGINANLMSETQMRLFGMFYNTFSSNKGRPLLLTTNNDGIFTYKNMVHDTDKEIMKLEWRENAHDLAQRKESKYVTYKDDDYIINKNVLSADLTNFYANNRAYDILKNLGIKIPINHTLVNRNTYVRNYLTRLRKELDNYPKDQVLYLNDLYDRNKIKNQLELDELTEFAVEYFDNDVDLMYFNQDGNMEWSISRNSHITKIKNQLNEYGRQEDKSLVPEDLLFIKPFDGRSGNLYNLHSLYWKHIMDGGELKVSILKGFRNKDNGRELDQSNYGDYKAATFDSILRGIIPLKRAADRGPEYCFEAMKTDYNVSQETVFNTLLDYLRDELITSFAIKDQVALKGKKEFTDFGRGLYNYTENAQSLRVFSFIFEKEFNNGKPIQSLDAFLEDADTRDITFAKLQALVEKYIEDNRDVISTSLNNFIQYTKDNTKESLIENMLIIPTSDNQWQIPGFNMETITGDKYFNLFVDANDNLSNERLEKVLLVHTYNYIVGLQEQCKIFLGDPANYANAIALDKRATSSASTFTMIPNDSKTLELLNLYYPKVNGYTHNNVINKIIVPTVLEDASKELTDFNSAYKNMKIFDGQKIGTLDFIRGLYSRIGKWNRSHEKTYQYEMQKLVLKVLSNPEYQKIWNIDETIFTSEDSVFKKHTNGKVPNKPMFYGKEIDEYSDDFGVLPAIKTLGAGYIANENLKVGAMNIDKMSAAPIIPSTLKENEFRFLLSMMANDIDKLGDQESEKGDYYLENLNIRNGDLITSKSKITNTSYSNYGVQQEIQEEEEGYVKDSTQKNCIIYVNCFNNGELLPEFKDLEQDIKDREDIINLIDKRNREKAIRELGMTYDSENDNYTIKDEKVFRDKLTKLFIQRLLPDNIIEGLDKILKSKSKLFDLFSDSKKVEQVLLAYIKNNVIRREIPGEMLVQESSYMYSEDLKFYERGEKQTSRAEVMIPLPKKWLPWVKSIGGLDVLNQMIADGTINKKLVEFTANRIPTAELNTIEAFTVKKFLPYYIGARIILPSAIVIKTSSDFDIDKLTSYFNSFRITKKGPIPIEIMDKGYSAEDRYNILYRKYTNLEKIIDKLGNKEIKKAIDPFNSIADQIFSLFRNNYFKDYSFDYWTDEELQEILDENNLNFNVSVIREKAKLEIEQSPSLEEFSKLPILEQQSSEALENRLNDIHANAVLHPKRFDQLVTPHSSDRLSKLADALYKPSSKLEKLEIKTENKYYNLFQWWYNNKKALENWKGIQGISFVASQNTVNSLLQQFPVEIEDDTLTLFFKGQERTPEDKKYSSGFIKDADNNNVAENYGQFVVAFVDVAKDPFIIKLHTSGYLFGIYSFLNRYGLNNSVGLKQIAALITSPIVKEYVNRMDISRSLFARNNKYANKKIRKDTEFGPRWESDGWFKNNIGWEDNIIDSLIKSRIDAIKEIKGINPYVGDLPGNSAQLLSSLIKSYITTTDPDAKEVLRKKIEDRKSKYKYFSTDNILHPKDANERLRNEIQILDNFLMYKEYALYGNRLNKILRPYAHNNFSKSLSGLEFYLDKTSELEDLGVFNMDGISDHLNNGAFREANNTYSETVKLFKQFYLLHKYDNLNELFRGYFNDAFDYLYDQDDIARALDKAKSHFVSFVFMRNFEGIKVTQDRYKDLFIGKNSFPKRLLALKKANKLTDDVFKALRSVIQEYSVEQGINRENDYITMFSNKHSITEENTFVASLEDMYLSKDPEVLRFVNDLFDFAMMQSGSEMSPVSFMKIIPTTIKVERLDNLVSGKAGSIDFESSRFNSFFDSFVKQFYKNNGKNPDIVYKLRYGSTKIQLESPTEDEEFDIVDLAKPMRIKKTTRAASHEWISSTYYKESVKQRTENKKKNIKNKTEYLLWHRNAVDPKSQYVTYNLVAKLGDDIRFREYYFTNANGLGLNSILENNNYEDVIPVSEVKETKNVVSKDEKKNDKKDDLKSYFFQLESNGLQPNKEIDDSMKDFFNAIGVNYTGNDKLNSIAVAELTKMTLEVMEGKRGLDTLPEEAAHFYVSLLDKNSSLYKVMYDNIINYSLYNKVLETYGSLEGYKGNETKLREEAIGKLIANKIINNNYLNDRQQKQLDTWWSKIWKLVKELFNKTKEDAYAKAAYDILTQNISRLSVPKKEYQETKVEIPNLEQQWNELPLNTKGIYKYDYRRTISEGENAYNRYKDTFGEENVRMVNIQGDSQFKVKVIVTKPISSEDMAIKIIQREDSSIENMKELTKAPVEFKADKLLDNFDTYFPDYGYLSYEEKVAMMKAIEDGEMEISCTF